MDSTFVVVVVVVGAVVAGFVQGLSGFGFGMVAMSFWAWVLPPQLAAPLAVVGALTGQVISAVTVRRGFDIKRILPFILGGLLGIPIGVLLLPLIDMVVFKVALGFLLAVWCPTMLFVARLPRLTVTSRVADGAIGLAGGVMGGLGGFTGVLPTLWCTLKAMDKEPQRAIIQNFNLAMLLTTMTTYLATDIITPSMYALCGVVAVAVLIPVLLGGRVYVGISDVRFRQIVLGLLCISGCALLAAALPQLLARQ